MSSVWLYFSNGVFLEAKSFGANATLVGEVVFNTSMGGFQEIISDPANSGLFVNFTMSEVGNYGANEQDVQSDNIATKGIIVRNYQDRYSNFRATSSLGEFLKKHSIMGISDIDTRYIATMIRDMGVMKMVASTEFSSKDKLREILESSNNASPSCGTKSAYKHTNSSYNFQTLKYDAPPLSESKVLVLDLGVTKSFLSDIVSEKLDVEVIPANSSADEIINRFNKQEIDGVVISSGSSNPYDFMDVVESIKKLQKAQVPLLGIGLGHHLIALANGLELKKLSFGHHGSNHPIKDMSSNSVAQYAQNHIYTISSNVDKEASITHKNLFDNSIEGLSYNNTKILSYEFYPSKSTIHSQFLSLLKR